MIARPIRRRRSVEQAVRAAGRANGCANGCTCHAEVVTRETRPGVWAAELRHDEWCPLMRAFESVDGRPPGEAVLVVGAP
jgi:hypothetical protein